MTPCYTWQAKCLTFPNPCGSELVSGAQTCGETQCWFWLLAAALGIALVAERSR